MWRANACSLPCQNGASPALLLLRHSIGLSDLQLQIIPPGGDDPVLWTKHGFKLECAGTNCFSVRVSMRKLLILVVLVVAGYAALTQYRQIPPTGGGVAGVESAGDAALVRAIESRASGVQLHGEGKVIKVLPDDNHGSRHQRFILKLQSGQALLIAHNIDLAPRINSLKKGDMVAFHGEYEWNSKGGVIHWTHNDPGGRHVAGWLRHEGRIYQ
jgi:hypothetical protein